MPKSQKSPNLNYRPKKVISLAPDTLIYINGTENLTTCVRCGKETVLVGDVTDVSATISLEAANSASFTVIAPRYDPGRYVVRGTPVLRPMSEVEIYMRGRFLVNGEPRYYPVFWGIIVSVSDKYSDGQNSLGVSCAGILRWWEMSKINVQPSLIASDMPDAKVTQSPWLNIFGENNPFEIIWHLATKSTGGLMAPEGFTGEAIGTAPIRSKFLQESDNDMADYWRERFEQVGKSLRMFGWNGEQLTPKMNADLAKGDTDPRNAIVMSPVVTRFTNIFRETGVENSEEFHTFGQVAKGFSLFASEITSKLEVATQVKNSISYEFYQDSTGEIIFKPPFYNLDTRAFPPYVVDPIDIVSLEITENEAEVITRVDVKGLWHGLGKDWDPVLQPYGYYIDPKLSKKFGMRAQPINMNFLRSANDCFLYAVGELDRLNKRRFSGSLTLKGRPELRVGMPIFLTHLDSFYYIVSISHSFSFGGTFNTTLGLEAGRRRVYDLETGVVCRDYIYKSTTADLKTNTSPPEVEAKKKKDADNRTYETDILAVSKIEQQPEVTPAQKAIRNSTKSYTKGIQATEFVLDVDPRVIQATSEEEGRLVKVPYTDSEGYEVMGGFSYGRKLKVDARGELAFRDSDQEAPPPTLRLSTAIDDDLYKTLGDDLKYSDRGTVLSRILNMAPDLASTTTGPTDITELGTSNDLTLGSVGGSSLNGEDGSTESLLAMEPSLRKQTEDTKCDCGRADKKIEKLLQDVNKADKAYQKKLASTQADILNKQERLAQINKDINDGRITTGDDPRLDEADRLAEELSPAGPHVRGTVDEFEDSIAEEFPEFDP